MNVFGLTHIGNVRESNQDCFSVSVDGAVPVWAVVCDGMGGANGGYYASSTVSAVFSHSMDISFEGLKPKQIENIMYEAVSNANEAVFKTSCEQPELSGMGTTLVATVISGDNGFIAHVGDSRAYLINSGKITKLTTDHSVVQQLVEIGQITEDEAKTHPEKNMITRAVGVRSEVSPEIRNIKIHKNDAVLLCTDGLTNFVDDDEILEIVDNNEHHDAVEKLISLALARGGLDNVTAVLIK